MPSGISRVKIANMALSGVGAGNIESFDEPSPEARQCKLWYDFTRQQTLEAFDWSFARKRLTLALSAEDPPISWGYRYQYPSDCIVARYLQSPAALMDETVPFSIEVDQAGTAKTIVTNMDEAVLVYTFDLETTSMFSPHFVNALAARLGAEIAFALTGNRGIKGDLFQQFQILIGQAPTHNANEEVSEPPPESSWISGR